jgi:hypothetical protein
LGSLQAYIASFIWCLACITLLLLKLCGQWWCDADEDGVVERRCVRVFDIASTSTLQEYQQHRGSVLQLLYRKDGKRLFSAASCGTICVYDVTREHQPIRMVSLDFPVAHTALALSPGATGGLRLRPGVHA